MFPLENLACKELKSHTKKLQKQIEPCLILKQYFAWRVLNSRGYILVLVLNCGISNTIVLEIPQFNTEPVILWSSVFLYNKGLELLGWTSFISYSYS